MDMEALAIRVMNGDAVSAKDAEAYIRSIPRTCRGKPVVDGELQAKFFSDLANGFEPRMLFYKFLDAVSPDVAAFAVVRLQARGENYYDALVDALRTHEGDVGKPCGYDFNRIILEHPFDGEGRAYACPQCGVTGTFRSPVIAIAGE